MRHCPDDQQPGKMHGQLGGERIPAATAAECRPTRQPCGGVARARPAWPCRSTAAAWWRPRRPRVPLPRSAPASPPPDAPAQHPRSRRRSAATGTRNGRSPCAASNTHRCAAPSAPWRRCRLGPAVPVVPESPPPNTHSPPGAGDYHHLGHEPGELHLGQVHRLRAEPARANCQAPEASTITAGR